jgi:hypothetical protein
MQLYVSTLIYIHCPYLNGPERQFTTPLYLSSRGTFAKRLHSQDGESPRAGISCKPQKLPMVPPLP